MIRSRVGTLTLAILVGLAACADGDDITGPEGLNAVQVQALAAAVFGQSFAIYTTLPTGMSSTAEIPGPQAATVNQTFQATVPCELGGSVAVAASVNGTVDDVSGAADMDYSVQQDYDQCTVSGGQENFTLDGTPGVTHTAQMSSDGMGNANISGLITTGTGALAWSTGGKSGTCAIALGYTGSSSAMGAASFSISGTVCGIAVSQDLNVTQS